MIKQFGNKMGGYENLQNLSTLFKLVLNICLSSFYFGYMMSYFNSIRIQHLSIVFQLSDRHAVEQGFYTGLLPISAAIGTIVSAWMIKGLSRTKLFLVTNAFIIASTLILQYPNPYTLTLGRLVQGMCLGIISAITSLYIKEIVPKEVRGSMGILHQVMISLGVLSSFTLSYVLSFWYSPLSYWRVVFFVPVLTTVIQTFLLHTHFNYQTPKYLLSNNHQKEARQVLSLFYQQEHVDEVMEELINDLQYASKAENRKSVSKQLIPSSIAKNHLPFIEAVTTSFLQQIIGVGLFIAYSGVIVEKVYGSHAPQKIFHYIPILMNSSAFVGCVLALFYMIYVGRRRFVLLLGAFLQTLFMFLIWQYYRALRMGVEGYEELVLLFSFLFRFIAGCTLGPITWIYIPEIVNPNLIAFSICMNWIAQGFLLTFFPIVEEYTGDMGYSFLICALFGLIGLLINYWLMIETKDKSEKQIMIEYDAILQSESTTTNDNFIEMSEIK